jgi:protoheme IX farnesyltransferase
MAVVEALDKQVVAAGVDAPAVAIDPGTCVSVPEVTRHRSVTAAIIELSKPRITRLVTMTAGVGFVLGLVQRSAGGAAGWTTTELVVSAAGCLAGTAVSSGGANALNQWWESSRDARMRRTMNRPIPAGVISPLLGLWSGLAMSIVGVGVLAAACGPAAALVSLATILIYVLVYTPSKVMTPWNTAVGAVPGALPPLIGWCAAAVVGSNSGAWWSGLTGFGGWSLFALMSVWQIPHFLALAWMYRDDYAAGGYRMLPSVDPTGRITAWTTLVGAVVLVPVTLGPVWAIPGALGYAYGAVAVLSGAAFTVLAARMAFTRGGSEAEQRARARKVFLASIIHLPLLLVAMTGEGLVRALLRA